MAESFLCRQAHIGADLWSIITGRLADMYLQTQWRELTSSQDEELPAGLQWLPPMTTQAVDARIAVLPKNGGEDAPLYVAFVRRHEQPFPLLYFVCEQVPGRDSAMWTQYLPDGDLVFGNELTKWPDDGRLRAAYPFPFMWSFIEETVTRLGGEHPSVVKSAPQMSMSKEEKPKSSKTWYVIGTIVLALMVAGLLYYFYYGHR